MIKIEINHIILIIIIILSRKDNVDTHYLKTVFYLRYDVENRLFLYVSTNFTTLHS